MFRKHFAETRAQAALRQGLNIIVAVLVPALILGAIHFMARWMFMNLDGFQALCPGSDQPCYYAPKDFWEYTPLLSGDWVMSHFFAFGVLVGVLAVGMVCFLAACFAIERINDSLRSKRMRGL